MKDEMDYLKCVYINDSDLHDEFHKGGVYKIQGNEGMRHLLYGNDDFIWFVNHHTLEFSGSPEQGKFVYCDEHGNEQRNYPTGQTNEDYVSTEGEEEVYKKMEQIQESEFIDDMSAAHHIAGIQKFLRQTDSGIELAITGERIAALDEDCNNYQTKQGGVGTLIDFIRTKGKLENLKGLMEQ